MLDSVTDDRPSSTFLFRPPACDLGRKSIHLCSRFELSFVGSDKVVFSLSHWLTEPCGLRERKCPLWALGVKPSFFVCFLAWATQTGGSGGSLFQDNGNATQVTVHEKANSSESGHVWQVGGLVGRKRRVLRPRVEPHGPRIGPTRTIDTV